MLSRRKYWKSLLEAWLVPVSGLVANIVVIVGVVIALLSFLQQRSVEPIHASLDYVERFNKDEVLAARNVVYRTWSDYDFSAMTLPRPALDDLVQKVISENAHVGPERTIQTSLVNVVAYFDDASACVDSGLCDSPTLMRQIGEYGRDFYCLYEPFISSEQKRTRLIGFAEGLKHIASAAGGCE